jgi:hypothetical protein
MIVKTDSRCSEKNQKMDNSNSESIDEEKPPILGSWKTLYLVVLLNLTALIILFYFFSVAFQ